MTKQEFEEELDRLIEEYALENDDFEDVHLIYNQSWDGVPIECTVNIDIIQQPANEE